MKKDQTTSSQPIFNYLHEQIISMQIQPGQKLSENSLAKQFNISRTPVREAIARLVQLGLVEVKIKSGTFVSKLSVKNITEAQFIRQALEVAIVQRVAKAQPTNTIEKCEQIIALQAQAAGQNHVLEFQYLDDQFHQSLASFTQFDRAGQIIQFEKAHLDRVRNLGLKEIGNQYDRVLNQHNAILSAIKNKNADLATQAMTQHTQEILLILNDIQKNHLDFFE